MINKISQRKTNIVCGNKKKMKTKTKEKKKRDKSRNGSLTIENKSNKSMATRGEVMGGWVKQVMGLKSILR